MSMQPAGTWDEDPDGASILLATGRARHDLLVVAEPALLTEIDQAWGRPDVRVRLSLLPGVSAPVGAHQEDALDSYSRNGLGVLLARGRTLAYEGGAAARTTALARIAAGTGVRAALLVTCASALAEDAAPGDLWAITDHLNLTGSPLLTATAPCDAAWDASLAERLTRVEGVSGTGVVALVPGPVRPTPAESSALGGMGADAVVMDSVAEAMTLASRGVRVTGLACVDRVAAGRAGQQADRASAHRPAPHVVRAAVEALLTEIA